jgi:hypothetical protein
MIINEDYKSYLKYYKESYHDISKWLEYSND